MTEIWHATDVAFRKAALPLRNRGVRLEQMGPFDSKGPVWCASRPNSPDVFFWSRRIGPDIRAFAGTANKPARDVEFSNPLLFQNGEWVTRNGEDSGDSLANAVETALSWADDHSPDPARD